MTANPAETAQHRALSTQSRVDLLDALQRADHPLTVAEAAAIVGLHPNTTRVHLEQLVEVGLAHRHPEEREVPGRPRMLYVPASTTAAATDQDGDGEDYKVLASLLAREMAAADDAATAAVEAGRRWAVAQQDTEAGARGGTVGSRQAVTDVVELMDRLGFRPAYDPSGHEILLHRCPFEEVARESRSVVCGVHLGLVEGAFERLGGSVTVDGLAPFRQDTPLLCAIALNPGAPPAGRGRRGHHRRTREG